MLIASVLALFACDLPDRATAPGSGFEDEKTSGDEAKLATAELDDDDRIKDMFFGVSDAKRIRTCAPPTVAWAILAYAPEVLDAHQVRTREIHCLERTVSRKCTYVADVRYYLDQPNDYFTVDPGVPPEQALELAQLARGLDKPGRLLAVGADKKARLITLGDCGNETQLVVRIAGKATDRRLEVISTRYSVQL